MATFSQTLNDPRSSASPVAPVVDTSAASALSGLSNILGTVGRMAERQRKQDRIDQAKQDELAAGQAIGRAQTSILDLEDERNKLLQEESALELEALRITQDGVTEEEQVALSRIEAQKQKFLDARQSGVLNPLQFQTRMNALQKAALADAANLAIQPQINSLFSQGRTQLRASRPASDDAFTKHMNDKFGVNGWTGVDAGKERGRLQQIATATTEARTNLQSQIGKAAINAQAVYDDALSQLQMSLKTKGAIGDTDLDLYRRSINNLTSQILSEINNSVSENRAQGIEIPESTVKRLREEALAQQKFYLEIPQDDERLAQRLTSMATSVQKVRELKSSGMANMVSAIGASGSTGDVIALANVVNLPPATLQAVISNLPAELQGVVTEETIREEAARSFAMMVEGVDFTDMTGVNHRLVKYVAGIGLKTAETENAVSSGLSAFENMNFADVQGTLTAFNSPSIKNNMLGLDNSQGRQALTRLNSIASLSIEELAKSLPPTATIDLEEGKIVYNNPSQPARTGRSVGGIDNYLQNSIDEFNKFLRNYKDVLNVQDILRTFDAANQPEQGAERSGGQSVDN